MCVFFYLMDVDECLFNLDKCEDKRINTSKTVEPHHKLYEFTATFQVLIHDIKEFVFHKFEFSKQWFHTVPHNLTLSYCSSIIPAPCYTCIFQNNYASIYICITPSYIDMCKCFA